MIKTKRVFLFVLIFVLLIIIGNTALLLSEVFSSSQFISVFIGLGITTLNFAAGITSAKISLKKTKEGFIKIVYGSMIIRLFSMLLIVLFVLLFLDINTNSFIFSIFIFYILYLFAEVYYLNLPKK
jgi:hypothetical protein